MQVLVVTLRKTKNENLSSNLLQFTNDYTMLVYFILTLHFSQKLHFIKQWGRVAWTSDLDLVLKRAHNKSTRKVERNYAATSQNSKKIPTLMNRPHLSRVIIPKGDAIFPLSPPLNKIEEEKQRLQNLKSEWGCVWTRCLIKSARFWHAEIREKEREIIMRRVVELCF